MNPMSMNRLGKSDKKSSEELKISIGFLPSATSKATIYRSSIHVRFVKYKIFQRRSMCLCEVASDLMKPTSIGDLPNDILHRILKNVPVKDSVITSILSKQWMHIWSTLPHLVFDPPFFHHVGASAASIIRKILMQHTENIQGFHLISKSHALLQSDVDQFIIFVSDHGVQKLTLDMANDEKYVLPDRIFTCATLTHLKLLRCMFRLPVDSRFPNLVSLQLEHSAIDNPVGSNNTALILPMLETLELIFCANVDSVNLVSRELVNLSVLSSDTVRFQCFNVKAFFDRIKYLCLDGLSLKNLGLVPVPDRLDVSLNLQSLKVCDLTISVKIISCLLCLLWNSPKLVELDIDEIVKVEATRGHTTELLNYLKAHNQVISEALRMIRTVRLGKFKGTIIEMYFLEVVLAHSPDLKRMIIEQSKKISSNVTCCNELLKELGSYYRASPIAEIKYI